jgi:hypothetical protein
MTKNELQILPTALLAAYIEQVPVGLQAAFETLHEAEISTATFSF